MGLLDLLIELSDDNEKEDNSIFDLFNLSEKEKKEVKKGNYDPWNFEEEELEEDDYYYEDE